MHAPTLAPARLDRQLVFEDKDCHGMKTYIRAVISRSDLKGLVPEEMLHQAIVPYARFVRRQYEETMRGVPDVFIRISGEDSKRDHVAIGPVTTAVEANRRLALLEPDSWPQQFAEEMIAQGTRILAEMEQGKDPDLI